MLTLRYIFRYGLSARTMRLRAPVKPYLINSGNDKSYNDLRSKVELLSTSFLFMQDGTRTETEQDSVQGRHVKSENKTFLSTTDL